MTGYEKSVSVMWSKVKMYRSRLFHRLSALVALSGVSPPVGSTIDIFPGCEKASSFWWLLFKNRTASSSVVNFWHFSLKEGTSLLSLSVFSLQSCKLCHTVGLSASSMVRSLTLCALYFNCSFSAGEALKTFHTSICIEGHVLDQATLEKGKQSIDVYRRSIIVS